MISLFSSETFLFITISVCFHIYSFPVLFDVAFNAHWMTWWLRRNWLVLSCLVVCKGKVKLSACPSAGMLCEASRIAMPRESTVTQHQKPRVYVIIMNLKWKQCVSAEPGWSTRKEYAKTDVTWRGQNWSMRLWAKFFNVPFLLQSTDRAVWKKEQDNSD